MKKIICLVLALVLCTALAIPAFAADAKEVEPKKNSAGNYEIYLDTGNYIIKKDCEVYRFDIRNCTLTIAEDVKVKVTDRVAISNAVLNIESGAVLEYCGDSFTNNGTMNVYGTVNVDSPTFNNDGIMNVYGTLNYRGNGIIANSGNFNKYCTGTFNGKSRNFGSGIMNTCVHDWKDGECTLCHTKCTHKSWTGNECDVCHYVCQHKWDAATGKCTVCGYACPHNGNECVVCHAKISGGNLDTGSALSEGSLSIITAVAGIAVGMAVMFLIMKKKKPALASGADNTDEE